MFRRRLIHNIQQNNTKRTFLRNNKTAAEAVLWKVLKNFNLDGKKFRRQHGIGPYIVDFYCPECRVAVELDGAGHRNPLADEKDYRRDELIRKFRVRVIRIENWRVFEEIDWVVETIRAGLKEPPA